MTNKQISSELIELGKKFTILYVEDDENIRLQMKTFFEKIFKNVYIGVDGEDGLRVYKKNNIDIVITDIDMPRMNGLVMSEQIRKDSYNIPIGIISAFEDSARFSSAIDVGVTKYILKPINKNSLIAALHDMVRNLQYRKDAQKLARKLELKKINQAVKNVTKAFLKSVPSPIFVIKKGYIIYMNEYTQDLLAYKNIDMANKISTDVIESIFDPYKNSSYKLEDIEDGKNLDIKLLFDPKGEQFAIYTPKKHIMDDGSCIVILNDIAPLLKHIRMVEYQKEKVNRYKSIVEDLLTRCLFSNSDAPVMKPVIKDFADIDVEAERPAVQTQVMDSKLSNRDAGMLRIPMPKNIKSAQEFVAELDDSILEDLEDLKNIEYDLGHAIGNFEFEPSLENIQEIANKFAMSASSINLLLEFSDFSNAIRSLATFLFELQEESILKSAFIINILLPAVYGDMVTWRKHVFEFQDTNNIHYLDSSIFSSIIQFQIKVTNNIEGIEDDEADGSGIDFF